MLSVNVTKNHVGEFCSKIRKEKKSVAIVVSFQNTVLHDIFLYYTDYSNYLPRVRPALFHVDNNMILNETKTKAMLATGKWIEKRMNNQQLQVKLNTTELKQVSSQKLLGVTIDQKLSIDDHINELCNKICQRIAMLSKIK